VGAAYHCVRRSADTGPRRPGLVRVHQGHAAQLDWEVRGAGLRMLDHAHTCTCTVEDACVRVCVSCVSWCVRVMIGMHVGVRKWCKYGRCERQ